jgi:hypothetical protein
VSANAAFWTLVEGADHDLLVPPVNLARLLLHPRGLAPRIVSLDEWAWHVVDALHRETMRNPNPELEALAAKVERLVPERREPAPDHLGFAVPLRLRSPAGELALLTTLTHFGTAVDVTVAELRLEAFLPADAATAALLAQAETSGRG